MSTDAQIRAFLRPNGKIELIDGKSLETIGSLCFGTHLKNWRWPGDPRKRVQDSSAADLLLLETMKQISSLPSSLQISPSDSQEHLPMHPPSHPPAFHSQQPPPAHHILHSPPHGIPPHSQKPPPHHYHLPSPSEVQVAHGVLDGDEGPIFTTNRVWWNTSEQCLMIEVVAVPSQAPEPELRSASINFRVSSNLFENGTVSFRSAFRLPPKDSEPRPDHNLFNQVSIQNSVDIESFTIKSKESGKLSLEISIDEAKSSTNRCVFVDVRKWGPYFDVRVGDIRTSCTWNTNQPFSWLLKVKAHSSSCPSASSIPPPLQFQSLSASLTTEQLLQFKTQGFLLLSDILPRSSINTALRAVNNSIGKGIPASEINNFNSASWCSELRSSFLLTHLFTSTKLRGIVGSLLGEENLPDSVGSSVQIALRFPGPSTSSPTPTEKLGHHIDGIPTDNNGLKKGDLYPFSLLVGVYLNDCPEEDSGNLVVYPGSHLKHAEYFKTHPKGPEVLLETSPFVMPPIDLKSPPPIQLKPLSGDVVLAHYLLAHSVASNCSPNVRCALYFRVTSELQKKHEKKYESMTDAWLDWPIIQQLPTPST